MINKDLEEQISISQHITSLILRIRKLEKIKVRQPLSKALIPALNKDFARNLKQVEDLIKAEVNVKELEILAEDDKLIKKSAKPNFKVLGPKVGADMKLVGAAINNFSNEDVNKIENGESIIVKGNQTEHQISLEDVEIITAEIPGWQIMSEGPYTVALDLSISAELKQEGIARELVNRIQNLRKNKDFEVTDHILVEISSHSYTNDAITSFNQYICGEVLAKSINIKDNGAFTDQIDIDEQLIDINLIK